MILQFLRALFVLLMAAAGWFFVSHGALFHTDVNWLALAISLSIGVFIVCVDILSPRRKLQIFSGTILGLLVGMLLTYALSFVVGMMVDQFFVTLEASGQEKIIVVSAASRETLVTFINLLVGISCCYLSISFILQSRDDFRFIIPYVEFSRQVKGARPMLLDTSVLIDGRIQDIIDTGIIESQLVAPRFVLDELQELADSADKLKRGRGRRGLDVLQRLRDSKRADVVFYATSTQEDRENAGVDQKLIALALQIGARVLTVDFNLVKVAQLRSVQVVNLSELARALKPVVLPGDRLKVRVIRAGEEAGQGVGYLEDGTMVVVEQGRDHLNSEVELTVTKLLQTSAGRLIFGRLGGDAGPGGPGARRSAINPGVVRN